MANPAVVIDHDDNPWGPFESPAAAQKWAEAKWPDGGWTVVILLAPN
jgi:hypothetical protein